MTRSLIAFLLAPAVVAVPLSLVVGAPHAFVGVYGIAGVLGIPTHFVLRHFKTERNDVYMAAGFSVSAVFSLIPSLTYARLDLMSLSTAISFGCCGSVVAWVFCLLRGFPQKPNKASEPTP